jgi:5'-nucleotidase
MRSFAHRSGMTAGVTALGLATCLVGAPGAAHAAEPAAQLAHDCQDDDHGGGPPDTLDLRRLAEKVVAWRDSHVPPTADPSQWQAVKLLGINDFHGALSPRKLGSADVGGAAVLAAYLKQAAASSPAPAFIVHAGDAVGASPPNSALLQDEPTISFLNLLANEHCGRGVRLLDPRCNLAGTLGNHEFDEGRAEMFRLLFGGNHAKGPFLEPKWKGAVFPYVSANVVDADSKQPVLPPFVIKRVSNKVNLAIIGAVLKGTPSIVTPAGVAGFTFEDEAEAINRYVPFIKALGVRTIVVTIHQGGLQTNNTGGATGPATALNGPEIKDIVSRLDGEIDVVISGHSHQFTNTLLKNAAGKDVLVTQAFANGTAFGEIDLAIDPNSKDVMTKQARIITTFHKDAAGAPIVTPDPSVAALVDAADAKVAPVVSQVVGTAAGAITQTQTAAGESAMGNLIADAQRWKAGTTFAFMNPGGIRANLDAGPATWGELFTIQPFNNDLVTFSLTGQQILDVLAQQFTAGRILQVSGLTFTWHDADGSGATSGNGPLGGALVSVTTSAGQPLDPAASYTVAANAFLAGGGDGFSVFASGTNRTVGPVDLAALVDYIQQLPQPFAATTEGRATLLP